MGKNGPDLFDLNVCFVCFCFSWTWVPNVFFPGLGATESGVSSFEGTLGRIFKTGEVAVFVDPLF